MTGEEIRAAREALGMTQPQLAAALGLPDPERGGQVTVSRWERGLTTPAPYLARALRDLRREREAEGA